MKVISSKLGRLDLADRPFASGGAGEVYRATDANGIVHCVKILTNHKPGDYEKLRHMADNPPAKLVEPWGAVCWPLDMVSRSVSGKPVGYVMPMALSGSVELSNLTNIRWPGKNPPRLAAKLDRTSQTGLKKRMLIACNLCAAVSMIHKMGCVFVDLKPQNILVSPEGLVSVVDLDSLQVVSGRELFRGPLGSPEYMPSESYKMDFTHGPKIDSSWDLFSLAVIIYEILLGIHPFTATPNPSILGCETIEDAIRFKMYVHGKNRTNLEVVPAPHSAIRDIPAELASLFVRAFDSNSPAQRPTAKAWGMALLAAQGTAPALSKSIFSIPPPATPRRRVQPSAQSQSPRGLPSGWNAPKGSPLPSSPSKPSNPAPVTQSSSSSDEEISDEEMKRLRSDEEMRRLTEGLGSVIWIVVIIWLIWYRVFKKRR